jgi:superfamily II RNA helicase
VAHAPSLNLETLFPFDLDPFQLQALKALDENRSVVVCAPTGSGKTLIGEYAIHLALAQGKRVFYTTPLKALSNQKLRDFRDQFGADRVGLLTGDLSYHRDARILVMTTEIFRNMLYGSRVGETSEALADVSAVVLDECHYMNDRERGTVWEESIIYCPPQIQLVALSATIANSDQLTDWINQVHGPTELVYSTFRPVPLHFSFATNNGIFPLLNDARTDLHPNLKARQKARHPRGGRPPKKHPDAPDLAFTISQLNQKEMLPAIYFIFSRRGCDDAVNAVANLKLVNADEARSLRRQIDEFVLHNPEVGRPSQLEALSRGLAAHHAGLLPAWKNLVEELFQQGLIKVVFATETLAAGINMPARTTVISSLSKRTDQGHRLLNASEFLQMSGRAGRRGMDDRGYVVTVQSRFEGAREAGNLATSAADPLVSQFTPSYGMVLNLLQTHSLAEAKDLVERSFGRYLALLTLKPQQDEMAARLQEEAQLEAQLEGVDWAEVDRYEKLRGRLKEEQRLLKILRDQALENLSDDRVQALSFVVAGTIVTLKGRYLPFANPLAAMVVIKLAAPGQLPYLVCLGQDNRWYVASTADVVELHADIPRIMEADRLAPPPSLRPRPGEVSSGDDETRPLSYRISEIAPRLAPPNSVEESEEVIAQRARTAEVEAAVLAHPVHQWGNLSNLKKYRTRLEKIREDIVDRRRKLDRHAHRHWQEFLSLMEILRTVGCLDNVTPTDLGETIAAIRGDNELWLGMALLSGEFDELAPHQLAAACEALVTEVSRPDLWTRYSASPAVRKALKEIHELRRQINQLQQRYHINVPLWYEFELTGLIEAWALGTDWNELIQNSSLDEGDVVRVLRRTLDFLNQIPYAPHLSNELKRNAVNAVRLIDRFPVRDAAVSEVISVNPSLVESLETLLTDDLDPDLDSAVAIDAESDEPPEPLTARDIASESEEPEPEKIEPEEPSA